MAESDTEVSTEELQKEIADILDNSSLENTSTKKVIQKLEKKLGVDLTEKKKLIDQMVMEYVNNMDSDEDEDDEHDDSNDSDYGNGNTRMWRDYELFKAHSNPPQYNRDSAVFLDENSEENIRPLQQESTITTSQRNRPILNLPRKAVILKRVSQQMTDEDECDIFGKLTAKKLRRLSEEQRDSMMIQINQLFYEKSYGRTIASPSAARHLTPTQIQAKKIFRVNTIPKLVTSSTNISLSTLVPAVVVSQPDTIPVLTNNTPLVTDAATPIASATKSSCQIL